MTNHMCTSNHVCMRCKKLCKCNTYKWACPWINEDEDQECEECAKITQKEMEEAYNTSN